MTPKRALRRLSVLLVVFAFVPLVCAQNNTSVQYLHDDLGRLIKVVDQNGNVATYSYDAVGNLLSITRTGLSSPTALTIFGFTPGQGPIGATVTTPAGGLSTLLLDTR